jgi:hypothetical protein
MDDRQRAIRVRHAVNGDRVGGGAHPVHHPLFQVRRGSGMNEYRIPGREGLPGDVTDVGIRLASPTL